jgi:hypothetical protein
MLGFLNSILNEFSLSITAKLKSIRDGKKVTSTYNYTLKTDNDMIGIIERRHAQGYKILDVNDLLHLPKIEINDGFLDSCELAGSTLSEL